MNTSVLDSAALAAAVADSVAGCVPATCRIGLLGLGNVGSAFARLANLLRSYGIWTTRVARRGDRTYTLTCSAGYARVQSALDALQAATDVAVAAFPAVGLAGEESAC